MTFPPRTKEQWDAYDAALIADHPEYAPEPEQTPDGDEGEEGEEA